MEICQKDFHTYTKHMFSSHSYTESLISLLRLMEKSPEAKIQGKEINYTTYFTYPLFYDIMSVKKRRESEKEEV